MSTLPTQSSCTSSDAVYGRPLSPRFGQLEPLPSYSHYNAPLSHHGLGISAAPSANMIQRSSPYSQAPPELERGPYIPVPIAPHPSGVQQIRQAKRLREEVHQQHADLRSRKRRRSPPLAPPLSEPKPPSSPHLTEEEQLLLRLKQEDRLPWKEIANRFEATFNKTYQVPALQMRYKRLREKMRTWTEDDVSM